MKRTRKLAIALSAAIVGLAASSLHSAHATLTRVSSAAGLNANLAIDWSTFGAPGASLACFCSAPVGPLTVGINGTGGTLNLAQEGLDYTGNFAIGANLLLQPFVSYENSVAFLNQLILPHRVAAVGTQMQPLAGPSIS